MSLPSIRSFLFLATLFATTAVPAAAHAQRGVLARSDTARIAVPAMATTAVADTTRVVGPRLGPSGIPLSAMRTSPVAVVQEDGVRAGSNVAMMGVGLAGIVVGSIVGGDGGTIIALGGAVIGLIGLFRYLR